MIERISHLNKLLPFVDKPVIKVITGIRRCGKSTLLRQIVQKLENKNVSPEQIILINMELMEFDHLKNYHDFYSYIKEKQSKSTGKFYVLIDEVQEVNEWEKAINSLLEEMNSD